MGFSETILNADFIYVNANELEKTQEVNLNS
jgi:hypothetical protein